MRVLIVTGQPHIPQYTGGVESTTHDLALELIRRGHSAAVLCRLTEAGFTGLYVRIMRKFAQDQFAADRQLGYPVYREWQVVPRIPTAVRRFAPDVAIVQMGQGVLLATALRACGVPVVFYHHHVTIDEIGGDPRTLTGVEFIANSQFTSNRYKDLFGLPSTVIPPLFRADRYVAERKPTHVTFINPTMRVDKGREVALKIAALCPEVPFSFVESWPLNPHELDDLRSRIANMPNVKFRRRTENVKSIYSKAKIILTPSICEEAWGRVATEAQFNGIPVVASDRGGLPESVGPGGVLIDPLGPIEPWVQSIKRLWLDERFYREKSTAALAYSKRPEIDPVRQTDSLLMVCSAAISREVLQRSSNYPGSERV